MADEDVRPRVLIADDEPGTLALIAEMLAYSGFDVVTANDGVEALVRLHESPVDVALVDVMMPGLDGRGVARAVREDPKLSHTRVVLHSSADEQDVDWRGVGADLFIQKPFPIRELPGMLRGLADGTRTR